MKVQLLNLTVMKIVTKQANVTESYQEVTFFMKLIVK
jgi:hypothetical protein